MPTIKHSRRLPSPTVRASEAKAKARLRLLLGGLAVFIVAALVSIPISQWGDAQRYERKFSGVRAVYDQWHAHLLAGEYSQAYSLMTPRYRFYNTPAEFRAEFERFANPTYAVQEDHEIGRFNEEAGIMPNVRVSFEDRLHLLFEFHQGEWQIKGRRHAEEEATIELLNSVFRPQQAAPQDVEK